MDEKNKTVAEQIKEARLKNLKRMQNIACRMNIEDAYEYWSAYGIPDEPSEDDFVDIAEDDELYEDVVSAFVSIIYHYGQYGILKKG